MKQLLSFAFICVLISGCSVHRKGRLVKEKIPDIAGTWYKDGDKNAPCYIVQNNRDLVFLSGNETANGFFKNSAEVFAKDWNRNAWLSNDQTTLRWSDRKWIKASFAYPDISGTWYENGEALKTITITQQQTKLVMNNGSQKLSGYFYATNAIYSLENNNYGVYSPVNNTITWGAKVWTRKAKDQ